MSVSAVRHKGAHRYRRPDAYYSLVAYSSVNLAKTPSSAQISADTLAIDWRRLQERYLPVVSDEIWAYSAKMASNFPTQGWKLHISATVLNAGEILAKIAPFLESLGALFKAPVSLEELARLNCGLYYGYTQVGKIITVYPRTDKEFVFLAKKLHRLTVGFSAPSIPFDKRFRPNSCVYFRYGAFRAIEIESGRSDTRELGIRDPHGKLVPDVRDSENAKPDWVPDLFPASGGQTKTNNHNPLEKTYKVLKALSQRGKGGVYLALDLSVELRLCVVKEGRRSGEIDWNGSDGYECVKHEAKILTDPKLRSIGLPDVYSTFELGNNFYLVTEYIEGENLQQLLAKRGRRLPLKRALSFGIKVSQLLSRIHEAGWVWRDCKPANLIATKDGELRPLDFEGACPKNFTPATIWGTAGYLAPEFEKGLAQRSALPGDLYALGAIIYYLFTGRFYYSDEPVPAERLRRGISPRTQKVIAALLDPDPKLRPAARAVARKLEAELSVN